MPLGPRSRLVDLGFVAGLLLLAAVPLVLHRGSPLLWRGDCLLGVLVLFAGTLTLWAVLSRRAGGAAAAGAGMTQAGSGWRPWWSGLLVAALLGGVVFVGFYRPLREQFWTGTDDYANFLCSAAADWLEHS